MLQERKSYNGKDEMTFYGFFSHMENFIKSLKTNPIDADIDDYLKEHGLTKRKALDLLLAKGKDGKLENSVLVSKQKIINGNPKEGTKDMFAVSYELLDGYKKKLRKIFMDNFDEDTINENKAFFQEEDKLVKEIEKMDSDKKYAKCGGLNKKINETDCCGVAGNAGADMTYDKPAFDGKMVRKKMPTTVFMTEEQLDYIKEATAGDIGQGYTAPASVCSPNDEAMDHNNIMAKSWVGEGKKIGARKKSIK